MLKYRFAEEIEDDDDNNNLPDPDGRPQKPPK